MGEGGSQAAAGATKELEQKALHRHILRKGCIWLTGGPCQVPEKEVPPLLGAERSSCPSPPASLPPWAGLGEESLKTGICTGSPGPLGSCIRTRGPPGPAQTLTPEHLRAPSGCPLGLGSMIQTHAQLKPHR